MSNIRLRRLAADHEQLRAYVRLHPRLALVEADGDPPEKYQIEYRIRSLRQVGDEIQEVKSHLVEIHLPRNYPRTPPLCRMLSPVFHPNIAPHAICVGDHWSAGESLKSIVIRIGEMLAYQSYNVKSPLNGEAARWVEDNRDRLPIDPVSLLAEEKEAAGAAEPERKPAPRAAAVAPAAAPQAVRRPPVEAPRSAPSAEPQPGERSPDEPPADPAGYRISIECPSCGGKYRVPAEVRGKKVRCKACDTSFVVP